ncbi:MAG: hypothetical protein GFH27_549279n460 [Chloroflexi bacterium AL-W]|nr:hypothetical protein [Chloroflexi bacterium AL-N1]NOK65426.1 hypothetical protein [Chloroflexi bacterium AL-N10]NOK72308.1 hypothetical protein [Chloroflexi bacterium AL-N5]NOK79605.1 hypothetical protein [Chloroflexi bacterium AL-W]NOK87521.1 hypothetical protein [Chloroflexi bacterium AL-N15]
MDLQLYGAIIRRYWLIVLVLPLITLVVSLVTALMQPPIYGLSAQMLVTRGLLAGDSMVGLTEASEDKTAQDLPAIMNGSRFHNDVVEELSRQDNPLDVAMVANALSASNQDHVVTIAVQTSTPEAAIAIAQAAVVALETNGLSYWDDDAPVTPALPGLNVAVLNFPTEAGQINGLRSMAIEVLLRTFIGFIAGIGIVFFIHYFVTGRNLIATNEPVSVVTLPRRDKSSDADNRVFTATIASDDK